jgi:phosphoribosylamine-glycine ligase
MNVLLVSNSASFHYLSKVLSANNNVSGVYHYGANPSLTADKKYFPTYLKLYYDKSVDESMQSMINEIKSQKIDLMFSSGIPTILSLNLREYLNSYKVPNLLPDPGMVNLESNRIITKEMLEKLNIPCSKGTHLSTWEFFRNYFNYPRPFVIKQNGKFKHGRQTLIVNDENFEELFYILFSKFINSKESLLSLEENSTIILEEFLDLKTEISYHALLNDNSWAYLGSARDYKKEFDGDLGLLVDSMGSHYIKNIDSRIHDYADRIFNYLKSINKPYKGFLFLGIGIDKNDDPYVLEINTRPGDPEISSIAGSVENFLEMLISTATNQKIPNAKENKLATVSVSVNNTDKNWNNIATSVPVITNVPSNLSFCLDGEKDHKSKHSLIVCSDVNNKTASLKIMNFLSSQHLGQFYFRKDIGILD